MNTIIHIDENQIASKIYIIRDIKVMLDSDLASLYGIETKRLKEAVRRNLKRFPTDFMFKLTKTEYQSLRTHFATLKRGQHIKYMPYAFTEQGIAMLSSVLNSHRAIEVNIAIMRTFVKVRQLLYANKDLAKKIEELESKYDAQFRIVFKAIRKLISDDQENKKKKIGFR